jgi:hypothetical protein
MYAVLPDGSGLRRIPFPLPFDGADVEWNAEGTKALVMYASGGGSSLAWMFDAARRTRRRVRIPGLDTASQTAWSPDGKRLVLATSNGDVVLDVETRKIQRLQDALADDLVTWSPDGKRLLFSSGHDLYTAPADGGPPTHLMHVSREPGDPEWSADGKWISFFDDALYAVRSDGTGLRRIDPDAFEAAWSPSGERLVFPRRTGLVLVDFASGKRRQLTRDHFDDDSESLTWSPDGKRIAYLRNDLGFGAPEYPHDQIWTVKVDGTDKRAVTHAFPDDGSISDVSAQWVGGTVEGTPPPRLPLVSFRATHTLTTALPIVDLAAEGNRAAVAQGLGGPVEEHNPVGPIVVWDPVRGTTAQLPVRGCASVYDVLLVAGRVAYRCDNSSDGYTVHDALRFGKAVPVRTHGEEFSGSFLGGIVADRGTIAFDVGYLAGTLDEVSIRRTRVYERVGDRTKIVRTFRGDVTVVAIGGGRLTVLRGRNAIGVFSPGGEIRTLVVRGPRILGAVLDGRHLVVLQGARIRVLDTTSGRSIVSRSIRRRWGSAPELADAQGHLVAYVVGVAVHVVRLSDGREIVIDTPNATGPVSARFVPNGLFYSFNASYDAHPGRLVFVTRAELGRALASRHD